MQELLNSANTRHSFDVHTTLLERQVDVKTTSSCDHAAGVSTQSKRRRADEEDELNYTKYTTQTATRNFSFSVHHA